MSSNHLPGSGLTSYRRKRTLWITAAEMLFPLLLAGQATAADFHVLGNVRSVFGGSMIVFDEYDLSGSIQAGGDASSGSGELQADSLADILGLRAHSFATGSSPSSGEQSFASAIATYQNVVVTGVPGSVNASLNLHLSGDLSAGAVVGGGATASVNLYVKVNDTLIVGSNDSLLFDARGDDPVLVFANGVLTDWRPPEGNITTPVFSVQAGEPFSLEIQLHTFAGASGDPAIANAAFGNTLSFAAPGPVFNLPAGYSVDGSDAGIQDNQFVAAPEPAMPVLTAVALLAQCIPRRRMRVG
jgi:hypothetical protein